MDVPHLLQILEQTRFCDLPLWQWMPLHMVVLLQLVRWMLKLMSLRLTDDAVKLLMLRVRFADERLLLRSERDGRMLEQEFRPVWKLENLRAPR